jgi:hypothetical protein
VGRAAVFQQPRSRYFARRDPVGWVGLLELFISQDDRVAIQNRILTFQNGSKKCMFSALAGGQRCWNVIPSFVIQASLLSEEQAQAPVFQRFKPM